MQNCELTQFWYDQVELAPSKSGVLASLALARPAATNAPNLRTWVRRISSGSIDPHRLGWCIEVRVAGAHKDLVGHSNYDEPKGTDIATLELWGQEELLKLDTKADAKKCRNTAVSGCSPVQFDTPAPLECFSKPRAIHDRVLEAALAAKAEKKTETQARLEREEADRKAAKAARILANSRQARPVGLSASAHAPQAPANLPPKLPDIQSSSPAGLEYSKWAGEPPANPSGTRGSGSDQGVAPSNPSARSCNPSTNNGGTAPQLPSAPTAPAYNGNGHGVSTALRGRGYGRGRGAGQYGTFAQHAIHQATPPPQSYSSHDSQNNHVSNQANNHAAPPPLQPSDANILQDANAGGQANPPQQPQNLNHPRQFPSGNRARPNASKFMRKRWGY